MALAPGTKLGPYEVTGPLGAGGMGEVYRALDTRLERTVAIKILPTQFSADSTHKQRFEREAKTISHLNHPHICVLHDIGHQDGIDYLVMECVEGETLTKRLERGPLPLEQILTFGAQIADALDKAHRSGVVHRDLKPGNIMLTASGAKLLDFGLAKPVSPVAGFATLTAAKQESAVTEQGTIVGTFQYMSPEQIEGKELDGRSDIFSLGAVLYEMVTGKRAFEGRSQLSVVSAILEKEPVPISTTKPMTPATLDHVVRCCLAKDPEERWQSARDLARELKWIRESGSRSHVVAPVMTRTKTLERLLLAALAASVAVALALGIRALTRAPVQTRVTRAFIKPAPDSSLMLSGEAGFALSPDGFRLAYVAAMPDRQPLLWVRPIDSLRAEALAGTEGASFPFWSPDGQFIGFFSGGKLKKISASGGPPFTLCEASDGRGGTWNRQGDILFTPSVNSSIYRVSSSGGPATPVTKRDSSQHEASHRWPYFLPDGRHFLYLAGSPFTPREHPTNSIVLGSLDSDQSKRLVRTHAGAIYASGQILFLRQYTLMAQPFDAKSLELTGDAVPVADSIEEDTSTARGMFSASASGLLTYAEGGGGADRQLVWFDRSGKQIGAVPGTDAYADPRISPDGKKLAYYLDSSGFETWIYDITGGVKTQLTFGSASGEQSFYPVWSPDGRKITYTLYHNGKYALCQKSSDGSGTEEVLLGESDWLRFPTDWSSRGSVLTYFEGTENGWATWMLPLNGDRRPYLFHKSQFTEREPVFSPDGKWLAYSSNEAGEYRIYVVPFPEPGGKWQVSAGAGITPRWRRDGKEIFYLSPDNKMMAADVSPKGPSFQVEGVHALFEVRSTGIFGRYDVTADGQRFVIEYEVGQPNAAITLVVNWDSELKKK
jgi:eukaryotic-like serine/threonine-protein kinase